MSKPLNQKLLHLLAKKEGIKAKSLERKVKVSKFGKINKQSKKNHNHNKKHNLLSSYINDTLDAEDITDNTDITDTLDSNSSEQIHAVELLKDAVNKNKLSVKRRIIF